MPEEPRMPGTIALSGLVDAYFEHHRFRNVTEPGYREYATLRLHLLEKAFHVSLLQDLLRGPQMLRRKRSLGVVDRDRGQVIRIARSSLERSASLFGPFGTYLEGGRAQSSRR